MRNKKGSVAIYITLMSTMFIIVVLAAIFAPLGVRFNAQAYEIGEQMMLDANSSIQEINDTAIRNSIENVVDSALESSENNIEVNAAMFKYSWIFVVALAALVAFLYTRMIAEYQSGFI